MRNSRRAATLGSLVLAVALTFGTATSATAGMWEQFPSLKACEKGRQAALKGGFWDVVGPCQKTKPAGWYQFYMYHY